MVGQRIKLPVLAYSSFGLESKDYSTDHILYLKKKSNSWYPFAHDQHIRSFQKGLIPFKIADSTFALQPFEYEHMVIELLRFFKQTSACTYEPQVTDSFYKSRHHYSKAVVYFFNWHDNACYPYMQDEPEPEAKIQEKEEEQVYAICDETPSMKGGTEGYIEFLDSHLPESVTNNAAGIQGTAYIRFVIEPDSSISQIEVLKIVDSSFEEPIVNMLKDASIWIQESSVASQPDVNIQFQ